MRKIMILAIITALFCAIATAQTEVHQLWGINYDWSIDEVADYLRTEKGIATRKQSGMLSLGDNITPITLFGYPIDLTVNSIGIGISIVDNGKKSIRYRSQSDYYATVHTTLLTKLMEKYGPPTGAYYEIYSHGSLIWCEAVDSYNSTSQDMYRSIHSIPTELLLETNPFEFCSAWQHSTKTTTYRLHVAFYNISYNLQIDGDILTIEMSFRKPYPALTQQLVVDETDQILPAVRYTDTGF